MYRRLVLVGLFVVSVVLPIIPVEKVLADSPQIVINEIRLGGDEIQLIDKINTKEYVTLFNLGEEVVSLKGWRLEYAKSSFGKQYCDTASWQEHGTSTVVSITELSGDLESHSVTSPINRQLNDTGSGSLRLVDASDIERVIVHDLMGWGPDAPCAETKSVAAPATTSTSNKSVSRYITCEADQPIDTNNNENDFVPDVLSHPGTVSNIYQKECENDPPTEQPKEDIQLMSPCDNLIITEVLPNPSGTDAGHEFIELYNPSSGAIKLQDCILKTSASTKQYAFLLDSPLQPGEFRAFYNNVTGLTLSNAAGGQALLTGTTVDYSAQYPGGMESDHTWMLIDGQWYDSALSTPNAKNVLPAPVEEPDVFADEEIATSCPAGKFRNPETDRCKNIQIVTTALTPCDLGQIRNAQTNRCRNISSLVSSLVSCKADQERNAETNRCRNVLGASTTQTPCQEGYERNPDTKRCRKSATNNISAPLVSSADKDKKPVSLDFVFMAVASTAVLSYGVYEYRRDFANAIVRIKAWQFARRTSK